MRTDLAVPGALVDCSEQVTHFNSKVGGLPRFAGFCTPAGSENVICGVCGEKLSLVVQVHVPLSEQQAGTASPERVLYLYGCIAPGCGTAPGSWRAFRWQPAPALDLIQGALTEQAPSAAIPDPAASSSTIQKPALGDFAAGDWGVAVGDWGAGIAAAEGSCAELFSFDDLSAALDGVLISNAAASKASPPTLQSKRRQAQQQEVRGLAESNEAAAVSCTGTAGPALPEFHLVWVAEAGQASPTIPADEQQHIQQLLQQYSQQDERPQGSPEAGPEANAVEEAWAGEGYERDSSLGADSAFLKFTKRLSRSPRQCIRYRFGGEPLWPAEVQPRCTACPACGAPRVFELQLMPPLIFSLQEAASWAGADPTAGGDAYALGAVAIDAWSWATVAVFSCSASCYPLENARWLEEQLVLQTE